MNISLNSDYADLVRGEGDWRNMQDVIRRSFKLVFDHIDKQQQQISHLTDIVTTLKSQLATKVSANNLDETIISKVKTHFFPPSRDEIDDLRQNVSNLKADIQRKASIRYVDDSLRRKLDKTDVLVKTLPNLNPVDITRVSEDVGELKVKFDVLSKMSSEITNELKVVVRQPDFLVVKEQVNECFRQCSVKVSSEDIVALLQNKVDVETFDTGLSKKADNEVVISHLMHHDNILSDHERTLTSIKLGNTGSGPSLMPTNENGKLDDKKFNMGSLDELLHPSYDPSPKSWSYFTQPFEDLAAMNPLDNSILSHDATSLGNRKPRSSETNLRFSKSSVPISQEVASITLFHKLQDSRMQSILQSFYQSQQRLIQQFTHYSSENQEYHKRIEIIEEKLTQIPKAQSVDTLAVIVNEQKLRIDGILTGSVVIPLIQSELMRLSSFQEECQQFLQLPKKRPIEENWKEIGQLLDALGKRMTELSTAVGRTGIRMESMEKQHQTVENRISVMEETLPTFQGFMQQMTLKGSRYDSLLDLVLHIKDMGLQVRELAGQTSCLQTNLVHGQQEMGQSIQALQDRCLSMEEILEEREWKEDHVHATLGQVKKNMKRMQQWMSSLPGETSFPASSATPSSYQATTSSTNPVSYEANLADPWKKTQYLSSIARNGSPQRESKLNGNSNLSEKQNSNGYSSCAPDSSSGRSHHSLYGNAGYSAKSGGNHVSSDTNSQKGHRHDQFANIYPANEDSKRQHKHPSLVKDSKIEELRKEKARISHHVFGQ